MIGPLLGALVSAGGIAAQAGASANANNINWANLFETKRANRKAEALQRSSRRDAYGNLLKYTPGVGWEIDTTPMTAAILGAQQKEELSNLREDAPRNRAAAERMDRRSQMGDEEFRRKLNEFIYRPKVSEAADIQDATNTLLSARRKGLDEAAAMTARQLMRTGGSSEIAGIYKQAGDEYAKTLQDAILEGKRLGRATNQQRQTDALQGQGGELQLLKAIADQTTTSPVGRVGYNEQLSGRADAALQQLVNAVQQGNAASQQAYGTLARGVANSAPDFSSLAGYLSRLRFDQEDKPEQEDTTQPYDPWAGLREVTV